MSPTVVSFAVAAVLTAGLSFRAQTREAASCQTDIVSSSVVATYCGHRENDGEMLDLLILWRGPVGWFQRSERGRGSGGARMLGAGTNGRVSENHRYGDIRIAFDADFDARTVIIGGSDVKLDRINTIVVDNVDAELSVTARRWIEPRLPLDGDVNLALARRSRQLRSDLRCEVPMPVPPKMSVPVPQPRVITVCERLTRR